MLPWFMRASHACVAMHTILFKKIFDCFKPKLLIYSPSQPVLLNALIHVQHITEVLHLVTDVQPIKITLTVKLNTFMVLPGWFLS